MVQKAFKLQMIKHNTTVIKGIVDSNLSGGISQEMLQGGGVIDPFNAVTVGSKPRLSYTTTDIKTYLDACGIDGLAITGSAIFYAYYRQMADGGTFTGSTNDTLATINKGIMHINSINAPLGKVATLSSNVIPTYDATNLPVAITINATAPTITRDTEAFIGGPMSIGGTFYPTQGWTFDLGANYQVLGADGLIYDTEAFLVSRAPRFTIPNFNLQLLSAIGPLAGVAQATVKFWLRKATIGGGGAVADATAEHILLTATVASAYIESVAATSTSLATQNLVIIPVWNITNAIVTVSTTSAIA